MKIAIIGGKLQATEAVYLAKACGMESILIDRNPKAPASGFADRFVCGDVTAEDFHVLEAMKEADFVLPANENDAVLSAIVKICKRENLKLAFDPDAYRISRSKILSDRLFHENRIPAPEYYPEGKPPYMMKPSCESGSAGISYAETGREVEEFLQKAENPQEWIVQEYLSGPSYSIEVIGVPGNYRTYAVTQIHMDDVYDCCAVTAPCDISREKKARFDEIGIRLAELVNLHGIMDVEVIDDGEDLKVLEIDARIPSQTPITVLYSSGVNELSELADITLTGDFTKAQTDLGKYSCYEHYYRKDGRVFQHGEHLMSFASPLHVRDGFCGSLTAITDFSEEQEAGSDFCGIFVSRADTVEELDGQRSLVRRNLKSLPEK